MLPSSSANYFYSLSLSFYPFPFLLSFACTAGKEQFELTHVLLPPKRTELKSTEPYWRVHTMPCTTAAGYLDILNVLNGSFWCLIDVDKMVCAKTSENVAQRGQLRQWNGLSFLWNRDLNVSLKLGQVLRKMCSSGLTRSSGLLLVPAAV